jgi:hypothetical protein
VFTESLPSIGCTRHNIISGLDGTLSNGIASQITGWLLRLKLSEETKTADAVAKNGTKITDN